MTFEDWLDKPSDVYLTRRELLFEDLNDYQGDNIEIIIEWLQAAYNVGYEAGFANYKGFKEIDKHGVKQYDGEKDE